LLRARGSRSPVAALTDGTVEEVLDDPFVTGRSAVRRVLLCSGKVSHDAFAARDEHRAPVAVVRVEQLFPWPYDAVGAAVASYPNAREIFWVQEEPENMGPWNFVKGRLYERFEDTHRIRRISRYESGSPATGSATIHAQEQAELLERALAGLQ
jgi:2-oxoglutarate dehydrogenase E1 component